MCTVVRNSRQAAGLRLISILMPKSIRIKSCYIDFFFEIKNYFFKYKSSVSVMWWFSCVEAYRAMLHRICHSLHYPSLTLLHLDLISIVITLISYPIIPYLQFLRHLSCFNYDLVKTRYVKFF